jgi:hypothetical protein
MDTNGKQIAWLPSAGGHLHVCMQLTWLWPITLVLLAWTPYSWHSCCIAVCALVAGKYGTSGVWQTQGSLQALHVRKAIFVSSLG